MLGKFPGYLVVRVFHKNLFWSKALIHTRDVHVLVRRDPGFSKYWKRFRKLLVPYNNLVWRRSWHFKNVLVKDPIGGVSQVVALRQCLNTPTLIGCIESFIINLSLLCYNYKIILFSKIDSFGGEFCCNRITLIHSNLPMSFS